MLDRLKKHALMKSVLAAATAEAYEFTDARPNRTFQGTVIGTGVVTATIIIEASNDGTNFMTLGTITLSGTTTATDGFVSVANWIYVRARLTAVSGTGAAVTVIMAA